MKKRSIGVVLYGVAIILAGISLCLHRSFSMAPVFLATGIGILLLKPFARYWAFATATLGIMQASGAIYKMAMITKANPHLHNPNLYISVGLITSVPFYLLYASIFYYFTRPKIREQFN